MNGPKMHDRGRGSGQRRRQGDAPLNRDRAGGPACNLAATL